MDIVMRLFQRAWGTPEPKKKRGPVSPHLERNALIVERITKGETLQAVATDYGVSRQRIEQIIKREGITLGYRRNPRITAMVAAYEAGESLDVIAARHGYPYVLARGALKHRGIIVPPKQPRRKYLTTPHGTLYAYVHYKCRCDACVTAQRVARREAKASRYARVGTLPPEKHGNYSTYLNWGCRCQPCRKACSNAWKVRNKDKINAQRRATRNAVDNAASPQVKSESSTGE